MRNIKNELQNIILGDESVGISGQLKKVQVFLGGNAETGVGTQKQECLKSEEAANLITFASQEKSFTNPKSKKTILSPRGQNSAFIVTIISMS